MKNENLVDLIGVYGARVDACAEKLLTRSKYPLYGMMRYFMGYIDEHFKASRRPVGKRIRPGLVLLIADSYGILEDAIPAALSVELFHNFTLIHDDVVDHDEQRRGRPTVWKLWGVDHAINTGDAQLILAFRALEEPTNISAERMAMLRTRLLDRYLEVSEGQYLDFTLATTGLDDPMVTEDAYITMTEKKTAKLIRATTEIAPILACRSNEEIESLGDFGENLGMAYQLYDDWQGIWGIPEKTGKKRAGDIYEKKKTLPVIYAREHLTREERQRLEMLYDGGAFDEKAVSEVLEFFQKTGAQKVLEEKAMQYKNKAIQALVRTNLPESTRITLERVVHAFVPSIITESR